VKSDLAPPNVFKMPEPLCNGFHRQDEADNASISIRGALPLWKRTLDFACLFVAAPALVPLMSFIALAIRLSSRGPVLFRQERIGFRGEPFVCFKFRTMRHAAETSPHEAYLKSLIGSDVPMKKLDGEDDRVLRIGLWLRASGLDELPQIFNILRGEMSCVGPRPCIRYEYERFGQKERERVNAVPGLTGLWQVSGKNNTTFQQMIDFDLRYAQNLSLGQDLSILFRTFPVLFQQTSEAVQKKRLRKRAADVHIASAPRRETRPLTTV
jgi:exopolysaccharide production protein ExoY